MTFDIWNTFVTHVFAWSAGDLLGCVGGWRAGDSDGSGCGGVKITASLSSLWPRPVRLLIGWSNGRSFVIISNKNAPNGTPFSFQEESGKIAGRTEVMVMIVVVMVTVLVVVVEAGGVKVIYSNRPAIKLCRRMTNAGGVSRVPCVISEMPKSSRRSCTKCSQQPPNKAWLTYVGNYAWSYKCTCIVRTAMQTFALKLYTMQQCGCTDTQSHSKIYAPHKHTWLRLHTLTLTAKLRLLEEYFLDRLTSVLCAHVLG